MIKKIRALLVVAAIGAVTVACNLPTQTKQTDSSIPAPNQTLTALFAVTVEATQTPTLPPIITATSAPGSATNTPAAAPTTASAAATNTPTTAAAATAVPATATVPSSRAGTVTAQYLSTAPTIDGDWSEWKDKTKEYPANSVVWGSRSNDDDLSASYHIGWDDKNFYVAVKVRDDKYVQNATGADIFKGDSLEILLDTNLQGDYYTTQLSPDDFQLGINPGRPDVNGTKEAYLWFPSRIAGAKSDVKIASVKEDGVYRVEAAIPWTVFEMTPAANQHYGFALSVSDNDDTSSNSQQTMVSSVSTRNLANPTTWGDMQLVK